MAGIYPLKGVVKHYDWGGVTFIPSLLNEENKENKPYAEYWMGTHPMGMGMVKTGEEEKPLSSFGGQLPFLFKLLDVKDMLSVQVHPSKEAAEKEFARENEEGIPLDSPQRNYRDDNHKPELMVALSDFWLLHGFKPAEELVYTLLNVVELRELLPVFNETGYTGLYRHLMEMPQAEVNRILQPLIDNLSAVYSNSSPDKYDEDFWAARAAKMYNRDGNIDRGIFSIYLFNLVHLKKGEGIFQPAGLPHAYLEGQNVEIMANSDNVLRGGLTTKHIAVKELLKHIKCEASYPGIISAEKGHGADKIYKTPVKDFLLSIFELNAGDTVSFTPATTEIVLLVIGKVELVRKDSPKESLTFGDNDREALMLQPGSPSAVIFPGQEIYISAAVTSLVFRASAAIDK